MTTSHSCKELFVRYLQDFSRHKPGEIKIMIVDDASSHPTKDVKVPENMILLPITPYCPELNPDEKVWQWTRGSDGHEDIRHDGPFGNEDRALDSDAGKWTH